MGAVAPIQNAPSREFLEKIFRTAFKIRVFETEGIKLYRQGLIRGYFHPYLGQEGIATGACAALKEGDYIASTHRGHGHCIAWGADVNMMVAELLQKETGYCKGYGGSMHIADIAAGNLGANGIVGAGTPLGVGAALANQVRGSDAVTLTEGLLAKYGPTRPRCCNVRCVSWMKARVAAPAAATSPRSPAAISSIPARRAISPN